MQIVAAISLCKVLYKYRIRDSPAAHWNCWKELTVPRLQVYFSQPSSWRSLQWEEAACSVASTIWGYINILEYLISNYGKWNSSFLESHPEHKTSLSDDKHLLKDTVKNMPRSVIGFTKTINHWKQIKSRLIYFYSGMTHIWDQV